MKPLGQSRVRKLAGSLLLAAVSAAQLGGAGTALTSGTAAPFSLPSVPSAQLFAGDSGFRIVVPAGATRLEVRLVTTTPGVDVDLYVRFGTDIVLSGGSSGTAVADYRSETLGSNEIVAARPNSTPPLQAGAYYIALGLFTTGTAVNGSLIATVDTGVTLPIGTLLPSGTATTFSFSPVAGPTLFNSDYSYGITAPAGATKLDVQLITTTPLANMDLYVRFGSEVGLASGTPTADFRSEGPAGNEEIVITPASSPALQPGAYYIALVVRTTGIAVSGTLSATVTGAPSATAPVIAASATSLSFAAAAGRNPPPQSFQVRNTGAGTLNYAISSTQYWLSVSPSQGTSTGESDTITVSLDTTGLNPGAYNGEIRISSSAGPASPGTPSQSGLLVIPVALAVTAPTTPTIGVSATVLSFNSAAGTEPASQALQVTNLGAGTLNYSITTNQSWLTVSPSAGTSTGQPVTSTVFVHSSALSPGAYDGQIQVSAAAGASLAPQAATQTSPVVIAVTLRVSATSSGGSGGGPGGAAGGGSGPAPSFSPSGIVNAASFVSPSLPGGAIARGSIFTIFGTDLGPASLTQVSSFPLPTALGGVSVKVTQGSTSVDALPLAAIASQINAIMPSNAPLGAVQITVTHNGRVSAPVTATVVNSSFGAFTVNTSGSGPGIIQNFISPSQQPINSATLTAKPGQVVTLWGTGLGPISAPDNVPPPAGDLAVPVEILVGGKPAAKQYSGRTPCCSGVDQIVFRVPADAPPGCFVPVLVRAGGTYSNTVTMSIDPQGRPCSDPFNVLSPARLGGEKQGMILLLRLSAKAQLEAGQPPADIVVDLGLGSFAESAAGAASYNPILSLPPIGSCSVTTQSGVDLGSLLGGQLPGTFSGGRSLDAGPALTVTGPAGSKSMPRSDSAYVGFLGGAALLGSSASPLFLAPGSYQVTGTGGADVGPFSANVTIPPPVVWTNRDQLTSVNRAQGLNVAWTGGDLTGQLALIVGFNVDQQAQAGGLFLCLAPLEAGGFTVPASALANIPPSNVGQPDQSFGFLMLGALPHRNISSFTAAGLDSGFAFYLSLDGTTISFQ